jgi:TPR repeat protein
MESARWNRAAPDGESGIGIVDLRFEKAAGGFPRLFFISQNCGRYTPLSMFVVRILVMVILVSQVLAQSASDNPPKHSKAEITRIMDLATAGDAHAQAALGQAYADGNGVAQNFDLALKWYHKAADQGNADAENEIGVMYRTGSGVEKSKEEAVTWYREAARLGNGQAMFNLGAAYYNGDGLDVSDVAAYAWFTLGKEAGAKSAIDAVARMDNELPRAKIGAGIRMIAEMYAEGGQVKQNDAESIRWYRKACEHGDPEAQVKLASMLIEGHGVAKDYVEGRKWCEAAAKQNSPGGQACMGYLYRAGLGVDRNPSEAIKYLTQAAQANHAIAARMLGEMYDSGEAGKADRVEALLWYLRAAMVGDKQARASAVKIKTSMDQDEWSKAQKRLREQRMDPKKVEAFLQAGNS